MAYDSSSPWSTTNVIILGEGAFEDGSTKLSGAATPIDMGEGPSKREKKETGKPKSLSKKAKTARAKLAIADGDGDLGMSGM